MVMDNETFTGAGRFDMPNIDTVIEDMKEALIKIDTQYLLSRPDLPADAIYVPALKTTDFLLVFHGKKIVEALPTFDYPLILHSVPVFFTKDLSSSIQRAIEENQKFWFIDEISNKLIWLDGADFNEFMNDMEVSNGNNDPND